ncbi:uncharacterized protein LOC5521641 isoform X2 [Nematostella vectensis]|uniref:uncharacterized protein LOC5521641 isoform X2 n=2 Tax=Nematostella vectensis TaxID=45351 RepID=UPI002076D996|nr:uncharacterized protein LOC5521641 isoform X2 [Nematostella vectensis]XP_048588469.1 uncharacterized protein LOC5521641 isoform X2 [Nematostella vectensis]XP_048588470.1 uncharacterized protein LOC5521641 isoform X2 [Nematostella vectensis]
MQENVGATNASVFGSKNRGSPAEESCSDCMEIVGSLKDHKAICCGRMVECPFPPPGSKASHKVKLIDVSRHMKICPSRAIECPIAGCRFIGNESEMAEHNFTAADSHLKLLQKECRTLRKAALVKFEELDKNYKKVEEERWSLEWKIKKERLAADNPILFSPAIERENSQVWRAFLTVKGAIGLQLVKAPSPVVAKLAIRNGDINMNIEEEFVAPGTLLGVRAEAFEKLNFSSGRVMFTFGIITYDFISN